MPVEECCLVLNPAPSNKRLRQDLGMGIVANGAVGQISVSKTGRSKVVIPTGLSEYSIGELHQPKQSKHTTRQQQASVDITSVETPKRKIGSLKRSGPVLKEEPGESACANNTQQSRPQHEQINNVAPLDVSYCSTPASIKIKHILMSRLIEATPWARIQVVDLSRRGLVEQDAESISNALIHNPQLAVLKLGYNFLGDKGASIIATSCSKDGRHHRSLTVLDLGFNYIGDIGCQSISWNIIAGNHTLRNLFLAGNTFKEDGAMAIAGALLHGCSLTRINLSANKFGTKGIRVLAGAIAEMDKRRKEIIEGPNETAPCIIPAALEELHMRDVSLRAEGIASMSTMLLTNTGLRILDLANNNIDDKNLALFSQTLNENKGMPLKSIILSFNKITCVGVEYLMNAVWGSKTLREIKLDNNKMQDRGAQLCSVVLTSIDLESLDISYNRVSTVGIRALMKSVSENNSLKRLALCGIPLDQTASKALSFALAFNASLEVLNIDSCCSGYSGQRYIVAGIVSNRNVKLRWVTGFHLVEIAKTLGLSQIPVDWGNDRVLGFVRYMWSHWQSQNQANGDNSIPAPKGPETPTDVAAAGRKAFLSLSESDEARLQFQEMQVLHIEDSPIIEPDTAILVRSESGQNLQIPTWVDELQKKDTPENFDDSWSSDSDSLDRSSFTDSTHDTRNLTSAVEKERRSRNLEWLEKHSQALHDIGKLLFINADLWQLHQHFFSPDYDPSDSSLPDSPVKEDSEHNKSENFSQEHPRESDSESATKYDICRSISFPKLKCAMETAAFEENRNQSKKRGSSEEEANAAEPCAKRARSLKPRIAFYPRIREKIESLGTKPSQTLLLLRQLKYMESKLLEGKKIYVDSDTENEEEGPTAADAEMILLDLL